MCVPRLWGGTLRAHTRHPLDGPVLCEALTVPEQAGRVALRVQYVKA